jgi:pimeloyl-ACP methyl ester carboxylesterase
MSGPPTHGREHSFYETGRTPLFASRYDARFSYCLYVPDAYQEDGTDPLQLVVVIHGTTRTAQQYRDAFVDFAEANHCLVLAPLFPGSITARWELDSYKFLERDGIRFDLVLLDMVDEVTEEYRVHADRFLMHGFSGGGQFAHRFFYLHPQRLLGLSVGAPGLITLLDDARPWWVGVADVAERFDVELSLDRMRDVPVSMVIGADDVETWDINDPHSPNWMEGAYDAGETRIERMRVLTQSFRDAGIQVEHDELPGVAHEGFLVVDQVKDFFARALRARSSSTDGHAETVE